MSYAIIGASAIVILGLGAFLIGLAFRTARRAGADASERDHYREKSEQARKANEIDEDIVRLSDVDLDSELRDRG